MRPIRSASTSRTSCATRSRFRAGQHLTLRVDIDGEEVRRNYSLCTAPAEGDWMVTVKRIADGVFSNWVGDQLKVGDTIDVMPPHGSFTTVFDAGAARRYVGFAGGSGITPVMSLIRTALAEEPRSRFTLFYGNRDSSSVIFLEGAGGAQGPLHGAVRTVSFPQPTRRATSTLFNGMLDRATCDAAIDASGRRSARASTAGSSAGPGR